MGCEYIPDQMLFLFSGVKVRCPGNPGHGSRFIENNAGEKVVSIFESKTKKNK